MTWKEIDRLTSALEREQKENAFLRAELYLRDLDTTGGSPSPEIIEALRTAGFKQDHLDRFQYVSPSGTPILVSVKTYPLIRRRPSRKTIEAILNETDWEQCGPGQWCAPGVQGTYKLREAYEMYRMLRGEPPKEKVQAKYALYVTRSDSPDEKDGKPHVKISFGTGFDSKQLQGYGVLESIEKIS